MMVFATSSSKNLAKIPNATPWAFLVVSFLGFLDATYLTAEHYLAGVPLCPLLGGCEKVLTSQYATVLGIPLGLLGMIYYLTVLILTVLYLDTKRINPLKIVALLSIVGIVTSLVLLYLQIFVIGALCLYCLISAGASTTLFVLGVAVFHFLKNNGNKLRDS